MLNILYLLTFVVPFPFWFVMIFRPNHPSTPRIVNAATIFLLLGGYYVLLLIFGSLSGTSIDLSSLATVEGLAKAVGTPVGALTVWSHMVIMDLIGGIWVYNEAARLNAPRWLASLCIFATLMSGPVGLFLFVIWRTRKLAGRSPEARQPHAV